MSKREIIHLGIQAAKGKDNISLGVVGFAGFGFVFRDITFMAESFDLEYTCKLCSIGASKDLLNSLDYESMKSCDILLSNKCYQTQDLYFVGALKTLVPSLELGGEELLFQVGVLIVTPDEVCVPATCYWGSGGLALGGWKSTPIGKFIVFRQVGDIIKDYLVEFVFEDMDSLINAFFLALEKVPIADFEGIYRGDLAGVKMGIRSGIPFLVDVPLHEDIEKALIYYEGEFKRIMVSCTRPSDLSSFDEGLNKLLSSNSSSFRIEEFFNDFDKMLIHKCYDELINFAKVQYSRYAYQALATFLMDYGFKIDNNLKKLILKNSKWRDERYYLGDKNARNLRRRSLFEFIVRVLEY